MKPTKKQFEEHLNQPVERSPDSRVSDASGWNNRSGARTRPYGTWLRNQDREKFNVDYEEWAAKQAA